MSSDNFHNTFFFLFFLSNFIIQPADDADTKKPPAPLRLMVAGPRGVRKPIFLEVKYDASDTRPL